MRSLSAPDGTDTGNGTGTGTGKGDSRAVVRKLRLQRLKSENSPRDGDEHQVFDNSNSNSQTQSQSQQFPSDSGYSGSAAELFGNKRVAPPDQPQGQSQSLSQTSPMRLETLLESPTPITVSKNGIQVSTTLFLVIECSLILLGVLLIHRFSYMNCPNTYIEFAFSSSFLFFNIYFPALFFYD
jgi:hypothetical protein